MLKQWKLVASTLVAGLGLLVACSSENPSTLGPDEGAAAVSVRGLEASSIQSMVVTAQPANVSKTLSYNGDGGTFTGTLVLPVGDQTLTANGYGYGDGGVVATGTAPVKIEPNVTTAVTMRIYDTTPSEPQPDIAPYIRSVTASRADMLVNETTTVAVSAVDVDGDTLRYAWTSDCASGTFANPSAATTTWKSTAPGSCTLRVTVSSRQASVSESVAVLVYSAPPDGGVREGGAQVNGEYVARPFVSRLSMSCSGVNCSSSFVYRNSFQANFANAKPGVEYYVQVSVDYDTRFGSFLTSLTIQCDGVTQTLRPISDSCTGNGGSCYVAYYWTTPASGACKVTGTAVNGSLSDSLSAGVLVK